MRDTERDRWRMRKRYTNKERERERDGKSKRDIKDGVSEKDTDRRRIQTK